MASEAMGSPGGAAAHAGANAQSLWAVWEHRRAKHLLDIIAPGLLPTANRLGIRLGYVLHRSTGQWKWSGPPVLATPAPSSPIQGPWQPHTCHSSRDHDGAMGKSLVTKSQMDHVPWQPVKWVVKMIVKNTQGYTVIICNPSRLFPSLFSWSLYICPMKFQWIPIHSH